MKHAHTTERVSRTLRRALGVGALAAVACAASCEVDSFIDPSVVGRWERTPVVMPILDQLDVIDEPPEKVEGLTQVVPEDLEPEVSEYVIGSGDLVTIGINELYGQNQQWEQNRRIDELGRVRLPIVGTLVVAGRTASQVEQDIAGVLERNNVIKGAQVTVTVVEGRQRTYSVIGESSNFSNTRLGTYTIPHNEFRLLEALSIAGGVAGQIKRVYIIRPVQLVQPKTGAVTPAPGSGGAAQPRGPENPAELIEQLMKGLDEGEAPAPTPEQAPRPSGPEAPGPLRGTLDGESAPPWVYINGKWVRATGGATRRSAAAATQPAAAVQRVIEVPYDQLLRGDTKYNVIIRPNDIIRIPAPITGNIYVGGQIARPGTFSLPGEREMNLKQLVFSAGGLSGIAIAQRVDLIRRIGDNQEATVRLDLKAIFDGTQPDFFLKANDTINFGTNFLATPLQVVRNGFRSSYGFGFTYDRNFDDVFNNNGNNN